MLHIPAIPKPVTLDAIEVPRAKVEPLLVAAIPSYGAEVEYVEGGARLFAVVDGEPGAVACDVAALKAAIAALPEFVEGRKQRAARLDAAAATYRAAEAAGLPAGVVQRIEATLGAPGLDLVDWLLARTSARA